MTSVTSGPRIYNRILIIYQSKSGKVSKRMIQILKMKDEYIVAYCYLRNQIRRFHKQRILATEMMNREGK